MEFKQSPRHRAPQQIAPPHPPVASPVAAPSASLRHTIAATMSANKLLLAITLIVGVLAIGGVVGHHQSNRHASAPKNETSPSYTTVTPQGVSIKQLGGWRRVSPPGKDPVFAYADTIDDVAITVSQQPLPDAFKTATADHVAELAKAYSATTKLDAGGTTVYIGSSSSGPQSVILAKNNVLVLIKSHKKIADADWIAYIKTLR